MCDQAVTRFFCIWFYSWPIQNWRNIWQYVSLYLCLIVYCPDNHKTQKMYDEAVDDSLAALKFIPDWFVRSKMIKKLFIALYVDDGLLFFDEDFGHVTFCCNEMEMFSLNLNFYLENNFDGDDPDIIIFIWLLAWHSKVKKCKAL